MRQKLALYVCPEDECAVTGRTGMKCPRHAHVLVRVIYVKHVAANPPAPVRTEDAQRRIREMIGKLPGGLREPAERIAKKEGWI